MFPVSCCFCEGVAFKPISSSVYHKVKKDHGPFDLFQCLNCNSLITFPLPDKKQLEELYRSFDGGIDPRLRALRSELPLTKWYEQCVDKARAKNRQVFERKEMKWLDAGAGNGELAEILSEKFPGSKGIAVDFSIPSNRNPNISWHRVDLNDPNWTTSLNGVKFDAIFSLAVLEHVMYPDKFLKTLADQLTQGGILYVVSPDNGSLVSKVLGKRWPYYLPGEHLNIPTMRGLSNWFQSLQTESGNLFTAKASKTTIPYPWRYLFGFLNLKSIGNMFSKDKTVNLSAGLLELVVIRKR